jgi:hypothetical protein
MRRCCNRNNFANVNSNNSFCGNNSINNLSNSQTIPTNTCMFNNESNNRQCECGFDEENNNSFTTNPMYGHAYVPNQRMEEIFNACNGLANGSIFPELVFPYAPGDSIVEANYLAETTIESGCNNNGM